MTFFIEKQSVNNNVLLFENIQVETNNGTMRDIGGMIFRLIK